VIALAIDSRNSGTVYAGTLGGIFNLSYAHDQRPAR
jgi:hypothetical protein